MSKTWKQLADEITDAIAAEIIKRDALIKELAEALEWYHSDTLEPYSLDKIEIALARAKAALK
jgi:phosphoglycerate-specific signal transduction histidine kinase